MGVCEDVVEYIHVFTLPTNIHCLPALGCTGEAARDEAVRKTEIVHGLMNFKLQWIKLPIYDPGNMLRIDSRYLNDVLSGFGLFVSCQNWGGTLLRAIKLHFPVTCVF